MHTDSTLMHTPTTQEDCYSDKHRKYHCNSWWSTLLEWKWVTESLAWVIVRLRVVSRGQNFLSIIGKWGLSDLWLNNQLYTECISEGILAGKSWNRAVRAHKLTMKARPYLTTFRQWYDQKGKISYAECSKQARYFGISINYTQSSNSKNALIAFLQRLYPYLNDKQEFNNEIQVNTTFIFWKQLMDMVEILLYSILTERNGKWKWLSLCILVPFKRCYHT